MSLVPEARDITALKEAEKALNETEARLQLAYGAAGMGTWDWDVTSGNLYWNDRQFELFDLPKSPGPIHIESAIARIHPDDRERVITANAISVGDNQPFREEFRVISENGDVRWLSGRGNTLNHDEDGRPKSLTGVNYDITERKNLELHLVQSNLILEARVAERTRDLEQEMRERQKTQEALSHSQRIELIGQLAGGVAHDFNNLLAVIGGNLELVTMRTADERVIDLIQDALEAVEAGASLNRRLLSFARKRSLEPAQFTVNDRIENTRRLWERALNESILLETKLSPDIWETFIDPGELDSAVLNIVLNARDAMPSGGKLSIVTRNRTFSDDDVKSNLEIQEREYVQLSISDTGIGMTPDVQEKVVTPFFTTKEAGEGSGLGLSSVFGFAKQSAGFVTIESVKDKGTTINVYLPRSLPLSNARLTETPEKAMPVGHGELILVVEDDTAVLSITCKRLIELGYDVIQATTAAEAIGQMETNEAVSLVFSDVRMPGQMSGYDLAKWVFENRS